MTLTDALLVCVLAAILGRCWQAWRYHQDMAALFNSYATMVGEGLDVYFEEHPPKE